MVEAFVIKISSLVNTSYEDEGCSNDTASKTEAVADW